MAKKEVIKSDVGPKTKMVSAFEIAETAKNAIILREYDHKILSRMQSIYTAYAEIGFLLHEINEKKLYLLNDNQSIYEYAKERFDLAPTTTKNVIAVSQRFFEKDDYNNASLKKEFIGFGFSQLVELINVADDKIKDYAPSMSVRKIRQLKALDNTDADVKKLISTNSELVDFTNYILNYDYLGKHKLTVKIEASSNLGKSAAEISQYTFTTDMNYLLNVNFKIAISKPKKSDNSFSIDIDAKGLKIATNSRNISHVELRATSMDDLIHWFEEYVSKVEKHVNSLIPKVDEVTGQVILSEDRKYRKLDEAYSYLDKRAADYISDSDVVLLAVKKHFRNAYYDSDGNNLKIFKSQERTRKNKPRYELVNLHNPSSAVLVIYDDAGEIKEKKPLLNDYKSYVQAKAEELINSLGDAS